jgi:hypothetical protein
MIFQRKIFKKKFAQTSMAPITPFTPFTLNDMGIVG